MYEWSKLIQKTFLILFILLRVNYKHKDQLLVQTTMDEENIGNPVDRGWSWVILFGNTSFYYSFKDLFLKKVITLKMIMLREIYSI